MEEKIDKSDLFLPSKEIVKKIGVSYPWEERVEKLVKKRTQEFGRGGYDYNHLLAAKNWGKILSWLGGLDKKHSEMVVFASATHDVGYNFLDEENRSRQIDEVREQKDTHAVLGVKIIDSWYEQEELISSAFNQKEWREVTSLVREHDGWDRIRKNENYSELLPYVFAADTLAQIDVGGGVKPSFDKPELRKYVKETLSQRMTALPEGEARQAFIILLNRFLEKLEQ